MTKLVKVLENRKINLDIMCRMEYIEIAKTIKKQ